VQHLALPFVDGFETAPGFYQEISGMTVGAVAGTYAHYGHYAG
jgi:hypothetical protein